MKPFHRWDETDSHLHRREKALRFADGDLVLAEAIDGFLRNEDEARATRALRWAQEYGGISEDIVTFARRVLDFLEDGMPPRNRDAELTAIEEEGK